MRAGLLEEIADSKSKHTREEVTMSHHQNTGHKTMHACMHLSSFANRETRV